jgi:hypothetical protein
MPIRVNLKEIFPSDPQEINVEKLNFNFNKLLELGVGSPGPIGLTGSIGPAGPIGLVGPQGDRGATWWVDSGNPNLVIFSEPLIDGDLYLDQTSTTFEVYQYDDTTSTWTSVVSIAAIVNAYLATASPSPFSTGPTGIPATSTKFVVFNIGDQLDPDLDYSNDVNRGEFNSSNNKALVIANFNETVITPPLPLIWPANQNRLYTSLFKIVSAHDDAQVSLKADLGRYHIELGSLYNDGTNILLSDLKHNLKGKFYKRYLPTPVLTSTNEWINTAKFSLSIPEEFSVSGVDQNAEFEFLVPKWNNEGISLRNEIAIRFSSSDAIVEQGPSFTHIIADGIHISDKLLSKNMTIGLAQNYVSANTKLNGFTHLMLDASAGVDGAILLNKDTFINGELDVAGPIITSGNSGLPSGVGSSPILAGNFGTPDIGRLYIGDGTGWKFHFSSRDSSINTDLVTFQDNGNVGIGISLPTAKVHINNTTSSDSFRVDDAASPDNSPFVITQTGTVGIGTDSPGIPSVPGSTVNLHNFLTGTGTILNVVNLNQISSILFAGSQNLWVNVNLLDSVTGTPTVELNRTNISNSQLSSLYLNKIEIDTITAATLYGSQISFNNINSITNFYGSHVSFGSLIAGDLTTISGNFYGSRINIPTGTVDFTGASREIFGSQFILGENDFTGSSADVIGSKILLSPNLDASSGSILRGSNIDLFNYIPASDTEVRGSSITIKPKEPTAYAMGAIYGQTIDINSDMDNALSSDIYGINIQLNTGGKPLPTTSYGVRV